MKFSKKIASILLISIFALSGCSNSEPDPSTVLPMTLSDTSSELPFENVSTPTEKENPYIDYLGTEPLTKTDGYILYYANYGQNIRDALVTQELVSQSRLPDRLMERIASDLSPDLCEKPENVYYLITKNMFEDLTKYIDTSAPQWQEYSEYLNTHKYNNGNYFYPTSIIQSPDFLAYSSEQYVFTVNGGKTPVELWREGNWNYETFSNITNSGSRISVKHDSSAYIDLLNAKKVPIENLLLALGLPFIDKSPDGKYFSNLNNDDFINKISSIDSTVSDTVSMMSSHKAVNFLSINVDQLARIRASGNDGYGFSSKTTVIVPYPAAADGRYLGITTGYLIPKRAKNIKAAASFINGSRVAARLSDFPDGLTDEDKEILTALRSQSYANMVESYSSYVAADTKYEVDKLWQNTGSSDSENPNNNSSNTEASKTDDIIRYHSLIAKSLDEINPK